MHYITIIPTTLLYLHCLFLDYKMGLSMGKPMSQHPFTVTSTQNPKMDPKIGLASLISASPCAPYFVGCHSPKSGEI
jgi:hypothetical protein